MSKIYKLTICYNEETDEVEYIEEAVDNDNGNIVSIGEHRLKDYFSDEDIRHMSMFEVGEA